MRGMPKKSSKQPPYPNFIREWRKYRGNMTQAQLVQKVEAINPAAIGTTASLSRIESGEQNTTLETITAIANVLGASAGALLERNPLNSSAEVFSLLGIANSVQRQQIEDIVKMVVKPTIKTGSED